MLLNHLLLLIKDYPLSKEKKPVMFLNHFLSLIKNYSLSEEIITEKIDWEFGWPLFCSFFSVGLSMLLVLTTTGEYPNHTRKEKINWYRIDIFFYCLMVLTIPVSMQTEMDWYQSSLMYVCCGLFLVLIVLVYVASFELSPKNDTLDGSSKGYFTSALRKHFKFLPLNHPRMEKILMYTSTTVMVVIDLYHENHILVTGILLDAVITLWIVCCFKIWELKCTARQPTHISKTEINENIRKWLRASTFLIIVATTLIFVGSKCIAVDSYLRKDVDIGYAILILQICIFHIGLVELKETTVDDAPSQLRDRNAVSRSNCLNQPELIDFLLTRSS